MLDLTGKSTDGEYNDGGSMMEVAFANGNMSLMSNVTTKAEGLNINDSKTSKRAWSSRLPGGSIIDSPTIISFIVGIDESNDAVLKGINRGVLAAAPYNRSIPTFDC